MNPRYARPPRFRWASARRPVSGLRTAPSRGPAQIKNREQADSLAPSGTLDRGRGRFQEASRRATRSRSIPAIDRSSQDRVPHRAEATLIMFSAVASTVIKATPVAWPGRLGRVRAKGSLRAASPRLHGHRRSRRRPRRTSPAAGPHGGGHGLIGAFSPGCVKNVHPTSSRPAQHGRHANARSMLISPAR